MGSQQARIELVSKFWMKDIFVPDNIRDIKFANQMMIYHQ